MCDDGQKAKEMCQKWLKEYSIKQFWLPHKNNYQFQTEQPGAPKKTKSNVFACKYKLSSNESCWVKISRSLQHMF